MQQFQDSRTALKTTNKALLQQPVTVMATEDIAQKSHKNG